MRFLRHSAVYRTELSEGIRIQQGQRNEIEELDIWSSVEESYIQNVSVYLQKLYIYHFSDKQTLGRPSKDRRVKFPPTPTLSSSVFGHIILSVKTHYFCINWQFTVNGKVCVLCEVEIEPRRMSVC